MKKIYNSTVELIGNTPTLKLKIDGNDEFFAKLEYFNPTFSIKDRSAIYMIEKAEKEGRLKEGGTIVEASSGNQGIAAAAIGSAKGYKVIITCSNKVSFEKKMAMKAYGAELIECEPKKFFSDDGHYYSVAKKISEGIENSIFLGQYFNPENGESHYYGLGKEIWNEFGDRLTHCCMVMGSGGTLCGVSKYLKEKNKNIKIIGIDSENSYFATKGNPKPYYLDGMGIDYETEFIKHNRIDDYVFVSDEESHDMVKKLARNYGLLVGPASAGATVGTLKYMKNLKENEKKFILTIFTDSGRAYLTKPYYQ